MPCTSYFRVFVLKYRLLICNWSHTGGKLHQNISFGTLEASRPLDSFRQLSSSSSQGHTPTDNQRSLQSARIKKRLIHLVLTISIFFHIKNTWSTPTVPCSSASKPLPTFGTFGRASFTRRRSHALPKRSEA